MVDHLAMRKAMLTAIDEKYMGFCNTCKIDYDKDSGKIENVFVSDIIYNIWFCELCCSAE